MDPEGRGVDHHHAAQAQGRRYVQVLGGGDQAEDPDQVGAGDVQGHRPQPGGEALPLLADDVPAEVVDEPHEHLQHQLPPPGHQLQVPGEQDGRQGQRRDDDPGHHHRLGHGDAAQDRDGKGCGVFQLRRQFLFDRVQRRSLLPGMISGLSYSPAAGLYSLLKVKKAGAQKCL